MEKLTLGQVIHNLQLDEVAIKVAGNFGKLPNELEMRGFISNKSGVHYDLDDHNILKSLDGNEISISLANEKENVDFFTIIKRDLYNRIKGEIPVNVEGFYVRNTFGKIYNVKKLNDKKYTVSWNFGTKGSLTYSKHDIDELIEKGLWVVVEV